MDREAFDAAYERTFGKQPESAPEPDPSPTQQPFAMPDPFDIAALWEDDPPHWRRA